MNKRIYSVNNWLIDLYSGFITHQRSGEKKRLGEYQIKLLDMLLQHAGKILSRDELTNLVWEKRVIGNNSLPNAIHTLRLALGDDKKQQRIIQTVPKKGYLLDASYCIALEKSHEMTIDEIPINVDKQSEDHVVEYINNESDVHTKNNNIVEKIIVENNTVEIAIDEQTKILNPSHLDDIMTRPTVISKKSVSLLEKSHVFSANIKKIFTLFITIAVSSFITFLIAYHCRLTPNFQAEEQERNVYNNIRLFQLRDINLTIQNEDNLYARLKDTLYLLDKNITTKNIRLNIYYHLSLRRLDYTFTVENSCEKQQLNMTIYHWRLDNQNLNNLIYRETERKINEMGSCLN